MVLAERIEHRAVAPGDLREGVLVENLLTEWCPPSDPPELELVGQCSEMAGHVELGCRIERYPEEAGQFGGGEFGEPRRLDPPSGEALPPWHANQISVQVVRPGVIRARQPAGGAAPFGYPGLPVQTHVLECPESSVLRPGQQDGAVHHRLGAVGPGLRQLGCIAHQLRAGHHHGPVTFVAFGRGVGVGADDVLGRRQVGGVVAGQFDRPAREVDELVAVHEWSTALQLGHRTCEQLHGDAVGIHD